MKLTGVIFFRLIQVRIRRACCIFQFSEVQKSDSSNIINSMVRWPLGLNSSYPNPFQIFLETHNGNIFNRPVHIIKPFSERRIVLVQDRKLEDGIQVPSNSISRIPFLAFPFPSSTWFSNQLENIYEITLTTLQCQFFIFCTFTLSSRRRAKGRAFSLPPGEGRRVLLEFSVAPWSPSV